MIAIFYYYTTFYYYILFLKKVDHLTPLQTPQRKIPLRQCQKEKEEDSSSPRSTSFNSFRVRQRGEKIDILYY